MGPKQEMQAAIMGESTARERALEARVIQLKLDLGHSRNNGYIVGEIRLAIDREMAGWEGVLPGCEPPEYALLQRLRKIAYSDNADMFGKPDE